MFFLSSHISTLLTLLFLYIDKKDHLKKYEYPVNSIKYKIKPKKIIENFLHNLYYIHNP